MPIHRHPSEASSSVRRLFEARQIQIQGFWKQWSQDYLHTLMQRPKWRDEQANLKVGQLVLIKGEDIPPAYWAIGRIIETRKGDDGKVRSVSLKKLFDDFEKIADRFRIKILG